MSVNKNINNYVNDTLGKKEIVLLDVRTVDEYMDGHIPNSINIPLREIGKINSKIKDYSTPIYVYCRSGSRSESAAEEIRKMGYSDVTNIGGIIDWTGRPSVRDIM